MKKLVLIFLAAAILACVLIHWQRGKLHSAPDQLKPAAIVAAMPWRIA